MCLWESVQVCIGIHYLEKILLFENITLLKPLVDAPVCVWLCVRSCFCVLNSHQANLIAHKLVAASLKISINSWFTMTQFVIWAVFQMPRMFNLHCVENSKFKCT